MVALRSAGSTRNGPFSAQRWSRACIWCALAFILALLPAGSSAQPSDDEGPKASIPPHVHVAPCLQKVVTTMLERSETFRVQMAAIAAAPRLGIAITFEPAPNGQPADAVIRRFTTGVLLVVVRIRSTYDQAQLVAHEIEHVREQIEGLPLAKLARAGKDVWRIGEVYETARAIRVGRRVSNEMRAADSPTP